MFSSTAEYALRAAVFLVIHREQLSSSQTIAQTTKVPPKYLSKILNDLVEAGIVSSRRGPNGGFILTRDPADISVLQVVNAVDPIKRIATCPLGIPSHGKNLCRLHRKLDDSIKHVEETLAAASILEMAEPSPARSDCVFPTVRGSVIRPLKPAEPAPPTRRRTR